MRVFRDLARRRIRISEVLTPGEGRMREEGCDGEPYERRQRSHLSCQFYCRLCFRERARRRREPRDGRALTGLESTWFRYIYAVRCEHG